MHRRAVHMSEQDYDLVSPIESDYDNKTKEEEHHAAQLFQSDFSHYNKAMH